MKGLFNILAKRCLHIIATCRIVIWLEYDNKEDSKMKPFDLEAAKAGAKVMTKEGQPVRLICFDANSAEDAPIIGLARYSDGPEEYVVHYDSSGRHEGSSCSHLCMAPVKREGWINIYKSEAGYDCISRIHATKGEAECGRGAAFVATAKVEWEE